MDESSIADLGAGHLIYNSRHRQEQTKGRGVSRSTDGGLSWSKINFDAALKGPVCQGSLAAVGEGEHKVVLFSNPASTTARERLTVKRSNDGGYTWEASLLIQPGKSAGYSSLVKGAVGTDSAHGGILFESVDAGSVEFATFP